MPIRIPVGSDNYALVDEQDREQVSAYRWRLHPHGYAIAFSDRRSIYMHRLILDAPAGQEVDHINGDRLDNSRSNLRLATRSQNAQNRHATRARSGVPGVEIYPHYSKPFRVRVQVDGRQKSFGYFATVEEATAVSERARREHCSHFVKMPERVGGGQA